MFDFGKTYTLLFTITDGKQTTTKTEKDMEVVSVEVPLVKFQRGGHEVVVNVASPAFVKGTLQS